MKIDRMNNMARNTIFAEIQMIYQTLVPFLLRTAMLYSLGVEYLGLNGLFASIIQMLNIAELGVESAIVFSLYKPIVDDDQKTVCALMKLYRRFYITIGLFIAAAGLVLLPFIPKLIQGPIPSDLNIYILYLLYLAATVVSYLVWGYKKCILKAYMRSDIISKVMLAVSLTANALQLAAICLLHSYYLYLVIAVFDRIAVNIISAVCSKRRYPECQPYGQLDGEHRKKISGRIRDLFTVKISNVVLDSSDAVIISICLGLTTLATYQNYYFVLFAVIKLVQVLFESALAGIGNSLITESKEKNYRDFEMMTFAVSWIVGWCACCLLCLYQPFMEVWTGKELLLPFEMVILFVCYFVSLELIRMINVYKDAAGIWHQDRFRPLTAAVVNLILSIWAVQHMGLYGVLLSSIIAVLGVELPWLLHNIFSLLFPREYLWSYVRKLVMYVIWIVVACTAGLVVCRFIPFDGWGGLFVTAIPCFIIPNLIFLAAYYHKAEFKQWIGISKSMWNKRKKSAE
ncbi:MAG: polysaccharide biosynthesis protein [Firmicutes bacterium]|nr:polysaccharide biosynthesis protein [Bacillota bacterium]